MSAETDHQELNALADQLEPQFEARFLRAAKRLEAGVDVDKLILALAKGDPDAAMRAVLTDKRLREVMSPMKTAIKTTLVRGGHLGAKQLNRL